MQQQIDNKTKYVYINLMLKNKKSHTYEMMPTYFLEFLKLKHIF